MTNKTRPIYSLTDDLYNVYCEHLGVIYREYPHYLRFTRKNGKCVTRYPVKCLTRKYFATVPIVRHFTVSYLSHTCMIGTNYVILALPYKSNLQCVMRARCVPRTDMTGNPESKIHGTNMGPTWGRQDPGGPHVGPMNVGPLNLLSRKVFLCGNNVVMVVCQFACVIDKLCFICKWPVIYSWKPLKGIQETTPVTANVEINITPIAEWLIYNPPFFEVRNHLSRTTVKLMWHYLTVKNMCWCG